MPKWFHQSYYTHDDRTQKALILFNSIVVTIILYTVFSLLCFIYDFSVIQPYIGISILLCVACAALLATPIKYVIVANIFVLARSFLVFSFIIHSDGLKSPVVPWLLLPPVTALLVHNIISANVWLIISLLQLGYFSWMAVTNTESLHTLPAHLHDPMLMVSNVTLIAAVFMTIKLFDKAKKLAESSLHKANQELKFKNEELNIQTEEISSQRDMLYSMTQDMEKQQSEIIELNLQLEDKIAARTQELEKALHELDTFVYRSAHDIKGPIATISGLAYVALMEAKEEKSISYLNKIKEQTKKTVDLLGRIMSVSELKKLNPTPYRLDFKLIKLKVDKYLAEEEDAPFVNIQMVLPEEDTIFYSDQKCIELVVINLLSNSIQFRDSFKSEHPYAILEVSVINYELIIRMQDNGIGIPDKIKDNIFNMFYKGSDKSKGSGLGLFMIKLVVEKLNGTVTIESNPKTSTTFEVRIPTLLPKN